MARHALPPDPDRESGGRTPRIVSVVLVWLAGIGAGMYSLLSVGVRYAGTCTSRSTGLACHTGGTVLGLVLLVAVVVVVTGVTLGTHGRPITRISALTLAALVVLGAIVLTAHRLLTST